MKTIWTKVITLMMGPLDWCIAKCINDIHGNSIQVDKSSGFHIFELHGYTAGVTSSLFISAFLLICGAYVAFKIGCMKMFACCNRHHGRSSRQYIESRSEGSYGNPQNTAVMPSIQMLAPAPMPSKSSGEAPGTLDLPLPRVVTLQLQNGRAP